MILSAQTIRWRQLLTPCLAAGKSHGTSYGLGPCGYDLRLVLPNEAEHHVMMPGDFLLVAAQERFNIPNDLVAVVHDKSTFARRGLTVQNTIAEPGWEGFLTLELTNHGPEPIELFAGQGIAQVVFHQLDQPTELPYAPDGKYQRQQYGPQGARS